MHISFLVPHGFAAWNINNYLFPSKRPTKYQFGLILILFTQKTLTAICVFNFLPVNKLVNPGGTSKKLFLRSSLIKTANHEK